MQRLIALSKRAVENGLEFLVIGGHALNAYGIGRQTADLDLMVRERDAAAWEYLLAGMAYRLVHRQEAFLQFAPDDEAAWPVDLILVDDASFEGLHAAGRSVDFGEGFAFRVPSALHLIALKLHALKQVGVLREMQDLPDIVALVEAEGLDYASETFRDFCLHYGNEAIYEQIREQCGRRGGAT